MPEFIQYLEMVMRQLVFYYPLLLIAVSSAFLFDPGKRPNIIFIVADDLGFADVGFRNGDIISPNIDKLAREGVLLNSSYVQPLCSPTRAATLTGRYPYKLGVQLYINYDESHCLPLNETLLPQRLKSLGYKTHAIGKWHLGYCNWSCTPTRRGFDTFYGIYNGASDDKYTHVKANGFDFRDQDQPLLAEVQSKYTTDLYGNRAIDVITNHSTDDPMFMWLSFQNVHSPVQVPDKYTQMYPGIDKEMAKYYGMVTVMDEYIGKIVSALKRKNMYDNTLLIFTSDNGGKLAFGGNNWPLRGEKQSVFEGGTRTVTLINSPLLQKRGYVHNGVFHAIDWVPTLLHFADGEKPAVKNIDGIDQFDMLYSGAASKRSEFIYQLTSASAIRVGDYKLVWGNSNEHDLYSPKPAAVNKTVRNRVSSENQEHLPEDSKVLGGAKAGKLPNNTSSDDRVLLFNLVDDPTETEDLSTTHPKTVSSLKAKLIAAQVDYVPHLYPSDEKSNPKNFGGFWTPGWC